jgi:hypothetical protein
MTDGALQLGAHWVYK